MRLRLRVSGAVQGVGFRPFVYRIARRAGLDGWVENSTAGVTIEVEGRPARLDEFRRSLETDKPPFASVLGVELAELEPLGVAGFAIRESPAAGERSALVLPDHATCADCRREIFEPGNRRHRYPFTNCTACGPRYSIILDLPYDRARTTMGRFEMCPRCRAEYADPEDRRFHAEPNACPDCGPRLALWDERGDVLAERDAALTAAAVALRLGRIVALQGLGGFHLLVDARRDDAVRELRRRKRREAKPLAVMVGSLAQAHRHAQLSPAEAALVSSPEAPIVLLRRRSALIAPTVAPGNPYLGLLLPYTPLHHLLMAELGFPVVATSGNLSDEPICTDPAEALRRLHGIADLFLVHDRPIARPVDDSVARVVAGRPMLLRWARGYAPLPVATVPPGDVLAAGGHLKNTIALAKAGRAFLGPHVGDLDNASARAAFTHTIDTLGRLYELRPARIACDLHPDYGSTRWARSSGIPLVRVQHHYAHALACLADNALAPPALAVTWDGSGYGDDSTLWGGEFLRIGREGFERVAHLRRFALPGGEQAVREPRRAALGVLHELATDTPSGLDRAFSATERRVLRSMLERGINCPRTSSAGRLFDAVAALVGLLPVARFEGQAAMALEFALDGSRGDDGYPFAVAGARAPLVLDWEPTIRGVVRDVRDGVAAGRISLRFHNTLVEMIVAVAERAGERRVLLSGGCFQNLYLVERTIARLRAAGLEPFWHQRIPPNDGGIAIGQLLAAARE
jgi:hydrogenase maturation protein HypF